MQRVEYLPFGETFIDERTASPGLPYKFNGKELDEETGLYYYGARYYDPNLSLWLSVDPLAEKYPNISSYAYCANNPVKYIDPDGRDAIIVVEGDEIIVRANIILYSETGKVSSKTVANFQSQIDNAWGTDGNGNAWTYTDERGKLYNVTFDVKVSTVKEGSDIRHDGVNNYIKVVEGGDNTFRPYVDNTNMGTWPENTKSVAHEFGHLIGLDDRYTMKPDGSSIPDEGYKGNIMGEYKGKVEQKNIDAFLSRPVRDAQNSVNSPCNLIKRPFPQYINKKNREKR